MSLEGLVRDIEDARNREHSRWMAMVREQYGSMLRAKDEEISALREEIETLRGWLDSSALPAMNPISNRSESLGLIKLNFGKDKPCPDMWDPGERDVLDSIGSGIPGDNPGELRVHGLGKPEMEGIPKPEMPVPAMPPAPPREDSTKLPEPGSIELPVSIPNAGSRKATSKPGKAVTGRGIRAPRTALAARTISGLRGPGSRKARTPKAGMKKL